MIRIIKQYNNRKLYDTEESKYITLVELCGLVKSGVTVKVVKVLNIPPHKDITAKVLLAALFETESKNDTLSTEQVVSLINNRLKQK